MKKIAITFSLAIVLAFAACGDNTSNEEGNNQVQDPVLNSGPEAEAERAKDAVKDSASAGADSTIQRDADAPSTPH